MLIARAPVRISFAGGGTDLPAYYEQYGGSVLSTTIDKYVYVVLTVAGEEPMQITSSDYRTFYRHGSANASESDLKLPRAVLQYFGLEQGVRVFVASEVPPGTGLGSSSAVTVALIKAVSTICRKPMTSAQIASAACEIEIERLGNPIGKQDQYAAAHGGFNIIDFSSSGVNVTPIRVSQQTRKRLEERLLLFYTGASRDSSTILGEQKKSSEKKTAGVIDALHRVKAMVADAESLLEKGHVNGIGELLHLGWEEKKRFASAVTNPLVNECYEIARKKGAVGGKLTGAGGGGFLLLFCEPSKQEAVTEAMELKGLRRYSFSFDTGGPRVLMHASRSLVAEAV